jgi:hypothetical protein
MIDARFHNHGSLVGIVPITTVAQDWIDENVDAEAYMFLGPVLYAEPRYAYDIANAMSAAGLTIE